MTSVNATEYYDRLLLIVDGHSGFGESGEDIVCAGVSAVIYTFLNCMLDEEASGNTRLARNIVRDGYVCLEIEFFDYSRERIKGMYDSCITGLRMLEESYPQYVCIK